MDRISIGDLQLSQAAKDNLDSVIRSNRVTEHKMVRRFEDAWAEYIGVSHCVAMSSGWGALVVALSAARILLDLEPKAAVLTTPLTYIATISAILCAGLYPAFTDVDPETFCMVGKFYPSLALPVDLMGYAAKIPPGPVIEDAAEAHGTIDAHGRKCGSRGWAGCFSFYVAHNIQAGEMGCITTNDREFAALCRSLKAQGRACTCRVCTRSTYCPHTDETDPRFTHERWGYNFKSNEFAAAIALAQVAEADEIKERRLDNVDILNSLLVGMCRYGLRLPYFDERVSYMGYPLVLDDWHDREKVCRELEKQGIETRPLFGAVHRQPAWKYPVGRYPIAERLGRQGFYIGCHQYLSRGDLNYMAEVIRGVLA